MTDSRFSDRIRALARRLLRRRAAAATPPVMSDDASWRTMTRALARETSYAERERLAEWCATDPERERTRRGLERITALSREVAVTYQREAAWSALVRRIEETESRASRVRPLFLGTGAAAHRPSRARRALVPAILAGAAATVLAAVSLHHFGLLPALRFSGAPELREYAASRGERLQVDLADGSSVTLGPESRLAVARDNFVRSRTVHLTGMAHFAVAHDREHPFVVYAGGAAVQAVGTAFTVRAYPDDGAAEVVVNQGRVLLRGADASAQSGTVLDSAVMGRRTSAGVVAVTDGVDLERAMGWLSGRLAYDRMPARDIARDLGRWYDLTIVIDDSTLAATRVNGYFDRGRSTDQAVALFTSILGVGYERHGDTVVVAPQRR
jgi:ferric-dicitrate binding protein FerR (iron transport regulator)